MAERLPSPLVRFISTHLRSVWALELLLILMREPGRKWTVPELVRDMRASTSLIEGLLVGFERDGLVARVDRRAWYWRPARTDLDERAQELLQAYQHTPFAVIQTIAEAPLSSIADFAEAFRLRGDRDKP